MGYHFKLNLLTTSYHDDTLLQVTSRLFSPDGGAAVVAHWDAARPARRRHVPRLAHLAHLHVTLTGRNVRSPASATTG